MNIRSLNGLINYYRAYTIATVMAFYLIALGTSCEPVPKHYNVLFIAIDDLRPELGCYGRDYMSSPNIDRLASEGRLFLRAYCQQALCAPSRASLLTGLYPDQLGVMDLNTHFRDRMPNAVTLPQHFKNHGYYSYGIGKVFHHPTGYDALSWSDPQPELTGSAYFPPIAGDKRTATEISPSNADYFDRNTTQMAIEKLKELKDTSFFLAVGLYKPHLPFNAPVEFWNRYNRADIDFPTTNGDPIDAPGYALRGWWEIQNYTDIPPKNVGITEEKARELIHGYRASVSYSDNHVGMLLHALDELGLDKNTIVVLWGDHGYKLYDYRDWCKHTLMEIDTRVPLIFRIPHMPKQGDATEALVESIDIYPTLADLCNIPLPQNTEGRSFKNVLLNPEAPHREAALSLYPRGDSLIGYSMRTEGFRFTKWSSSTNFTRYDSLELYDLDKDPRAFVNMAYKEKYSRVTSRYLKSMDSLLSGRAYSTFSGLDITGTK